MKVIRDQILLCEDCLFGAVNGEFDAIESDADRLAAVVAGLNKLGPHLVSDFDVETGRGIHDLAHYCRATAAAPSSTARATSSPSSASSPGPPGPLSPRCHAASPDLATPTPLKEHTAMSQLTSFRLTWSPEGKYIGTVKAKDPKSARRNAPLPYRKYLGEIAVEEGSGPPVTVEEIPVLSVHARALYRIDWYRNGNCFVSSLVNGCLVATYLDGKWSEDDGKLPDDIRTLAMESRPSVSEST